MIARLHFVAGAALLALAGCVHAPAHRPPAAPLDATAVGLGASVAPAVPDRWWRAFGDERLDDLVAQATRSNPTLAEAIARLDRARAEAQAAGAVRAPQLAVDGSVLRERFSARYVIPPPYGGGSYWDGQLDLGLSYDLDLWGRQRAVIRAATDAVRARELDAQAATLALQGAVVSAYLELGRRHDLAELAADLEANRSELAALTRRRVDAGLDSGIERRSADATVPEARDDRDQATAAIELSWHRIAALTGRGAVAASAPQRPRVDFDAALPVPAELPGDLLLRRADVRAALARVGSAAAGADAARLAAYPDLNLRAFVGFAALTLGDLLSAPARTYGAGPALHLPIFDAGLIRARARGAGADLDAAIAAYNRTVLEAVREAADDLSSLEALQRERAEAEHRATLLGEARRLAEERYRGGLGTRLAVLEAEARELAARRALLNLRALAAQGRVALVIALGGPSTPNSTLSAEASP
ncbi:MAG: efflux transporter outer membrane subunit [Proteobacteria bacterium]|nr:efflux transporter outer membrane subunit [Pseudomonadota bacterium]